ncbi:helix-turn-helix domain-containing protein [Dactylosporangium sp. CS-033363]|uniref:helix-turn-helix domain-containing protein n=1 Tax=Dactylosporangium sp. CS-033363 TaxID=3239935 RepID=UPI003D93124D
MAGSPTVRRRRLAVELRRRREQIGLTIDEAASAADISKSALSRIENALVTPRVPVVRALIHAYKIDESGASALVELSREASRRGWWQSYGDVLSEQTSNFIGFEAEASAIRTYECLVVPGILQTAEYAKAITRGFQLPFDDETVERIIAARIRRKERLDEQLELWAIIEEHVLRRPTGGPAVMRGQLAHLAELSRTRPNVTLQVLPNSISAHPGFDGPFVVLEFGNAGDPDLGYVESQAGELWLDRPDDVRRLNRAFDHLRAFAMSPEASINLLEDLSRTT